MNAKFQLQKPIQGAFIFYQRLYVNYPTGTEVYLVNCKDGQGQGRELKVLKVMDKQRSIRAGTASQAVEEAKMNLQIQHPNLIKMFTAFHTPTKLCLLMEFGGSSLYEVVFDMPEGRTLGEENLRMISKGIIKGILYLHKEGIAHRDIKPENIFLTHLSVPKISDLGLSKKFSVGELMKTFCGTLIYLAPEVIKQIDAEKRDQLNIERFTEGYTEIVDFWSIAIMIHEMISGFALVPCFINDQALLSDQHFELAFMKEIVSEREMPWHYEYNVTLMQGYPLLSDLLCKMLEKKENKRLVGEDILKHDFFKTNIDSPSICEFFRITGLPALQECQTPEHIFKDLHCQHCELWQEVQGAYENTYLHDSHSVGSCSFCLDSENFEFSSIPDPEPK